MKKEPKAAVGDRYDVILTDGGDQEIEVARIVKEITGRHRSAAELTELFDCPTPIVEGVTEDEAEKIKRRIERAHDSAKITRARDSWPSRSAKNGR
jgi:ribosomal protein L7/L12